MPHAHTFFHAPLSTPAILTATSGWIIMPCCRSQRSLLLFRASFIDSVQAEPSKLYAIEPISCPRLEPNYRPAHLPNYLINTSWRYGVKLGVPFATTDVQRDVTQRLR